MPEKQLSYRQKQIVQLQKIAALRMDLARQRPGAHYERGIHAAKAFFIIMQSPTLRMTVEHALLSIGPVKRAELPGFRIQREVLNRPLSTSLHAQSIAIRQYDIVDCITNTQRVLSAVVANFHDWQDGDSGWQYPRYLSDPRAMRSAEITELTKVMEATEVEYVPVSQPTNLRPGN
jgi:hypothetical protein